MKATRRRIVVWPFQFAAGGRLLTKAGAPIELGARALDILIALTSSPNEVISKKDLIARVWPDVVVEEGSLRFHMINLRKALGDGKDGARHHDASGTGLLLRRTRRTGGRRFAPCRA